ncbi:MAG: bifunctional 3,4-dihydroxy-2-butanone-4-phosphate synthase/GTP cyclohydrolase II [Waddliaceae bacterium]|nr:bifunctional 3,4-dihydroxy-2-butanone-4-phosphate synthase/GTP cyclohydrolase II [Waddliaceae bacterium]
MSEQRIKEAIQSLKNGNFVVVMDDEDRENEGDLILAAEHATPEKLAFMIRHTSGIVCISIEGERLDELNLPLMVAQNTESQRTAFTVSVDLKAGTTTGISAEDRAATIQALIDPKTKPEDLNRPGHIFPLRYREGGVLKRAGHTEAAVDLAKLAGLKGAGVICEIVKDDGTMARRADLELFAKEHQLPILTVEDIIRYRRKTEKIVQHISHAQLPLKMGNFQAHVYQSVLDEIEHVALVMGDPRGKENVLVRVHSECLTGDIFGSLRCDCGSQLQRALKQIADEGCGVLVYLRGHEGRGIGLAHKLRAYQLQEKGRDTVEANLELGLPVDSREYGVGAQILHDLGITSMRLLTNNPTKYGGLAGYDLRITERVPLLGTVTDENCNYLQTKQEKMGHFLTKENREIYATT